MQMLINTLCLLKMAEYSSVLLYLYENPVAPSAGHDLKVDAGDRLSTKY